MRILKSSIAITLVVTWLGLVTRSSAAPNTTIVEVSTKHGRVAPNASGVALPPGTGDLSFNIKPSSPFVRYQLKGVDAGWQQRNENIFLRLQFLNADGDIIEMHSFPANGRSPGWKDDLGSSVFTPRLETLTVPPEATSVAIVVTTAGPPNLVGIFAIRNLSIVTGESAGERKSEDLPDITHSGPPAIKWRKSGTRPTMASTISGKDNPKQPKIFAIKDTDLAAHADWIGTMPLPSSTRGGEWLELRWEETFSTGLGGEFTVAYERVPAGSFQFLVEDLSLTGSPLPSRAVVHLKIPPVIWKTPEFWILIAVTVCVLLVGMARHHVHLKVRRLTEKEKILSDERRRIALELHDDVGTRISHISLIASHPESATNPERSNKALQEIVSMSQDLGGALSESVWMLNPENDHLESLIHFVYTHVSEICGLKGIKCRADAAFIRGHQRVTYEFRHNMTLAVKETMNNVVKHSRATELELVIQFEEGMLIIIISDNGVGLKSQPRSGALGMGSLQSRMKSLGGDCHIHEGNQGGLRVTLSAPLLQINQLHY